MSTNSSSYGTPDSLTQSRLLEIAVPELYEQNAFRVLGLAVDASLRDVRRKQKKLERSERLGLSSNYHGGFLPLMPAPREDDTRKAMHRIQDPIARFLDEFFWFWPRDAGAKNDDALALLWRKRVQDAHKLWLRYEGGSSADKVSSHNLAVLYHVSALDFEQRLLKEDLTEEEHKTRVGCWQRTYGRWRLVLSDKGFWNRVRKRILEIDDPQVTPQTVDEIRDCLGKAILLIHARIAVRAAERGKVGDAQQHVAIMGNSGLESRLRDAALRESVKYVRQRIKMLCDAAEPRADADPPNANIVTWDLLRETTPPLAIMDAVLPASDTMRLGAHNEVASKALGCLGTYWKPTKDWPGSLKILEAVLKIAGTETKREELIQLIEIIKRNIEFGTCYFCGLNSCHDDAAVNVRMYGNVQRSWPNRVTWQSLTARIPRCRECKKNHRNIDIWTASLTFAGALLGALGYFADTSAGLVAVLPFAILGWIVGNRISKAKIPYKIKGRKDYEEFPRIKELRTKGWKVGKRPTNY